MSEIALPSARGGRGFSEPLVVSIVRPLTEDDIPRLLEPVGSKPQDLRQIRHTHHLLAKCLATDGCSDAEASLITGYSPSYISILKGDPAFGELLAYYETNRDLALADVLERRKALGLSVLDELQARLEDDPKSWTKRELMELADLSLGKVGETQVRGGAPLGGAGGVQVNVQFVASGPKDITPEAEITVEAKS